jgi:hypothetical protein
MVIVALAMGFATSASAKDQNGGKHRIPNVDRTRWRTAQREEERQQLARERHEREAMHRWDREHNLRPLNSRDQAPRIYVNHHYERRGFPYPVNQQGTNRP